MSLKSGRTPKSIRTRQAIEAAARELFASHGYERATVRDIGVRAGIDPAMVIRYFGSKDALFSKVATPDLKLAAFENVDAADIGEAIVRHFLEIWEGEASGGGMRVLLRSAASNEEAAAHMRSVFASQVVPALARIGTPASAIERAALVTTQLIGLAMTRYVLGVPPVVAMTPDFIIREVGRTIQQYATDQPV
jgi:AcrR family transcriptional regulator